MATQGLNLPAALRFQVSGTPDIQPFGTFTKSRLPANPMLEIKADCQLTTQVLSFDKAAQQSNRHNSGVLNCSIAMLWQ